MPDSVNIDWGALQPPPNIAGGLSQSFEAGRQMGLQRQSDNALARARANPEDPQAITDLALYNPQAANAFMAVQANNRAIKARAAAYNVFRAYGGINTPAPVTTDPAPVLPTPAGAASPGLQAVMAGVNGSVPTTPPPALAGAPQPPPQPGATSPSAMLQPDHPITQAVGAAVSEGKMTLPEAIAQFAQYADPQETTALVGSIAAMDKLRRDKLGESSDALASEAQALKGVPQAQRLAVALAALPQLAAHGITEEMLRGADLSDNGLNGIIGQSIGAKALIEEADKQTELGYEKDRIGLTREQLVETKRHDIADENKPVNAPLGNALVNPVTGKVVYDGFGGDGGGTGDPYNSYIGDGKYGKAPGPITSMTMGQVSDFGRSKLIPGTKAAGIGKDSRGLLGSSAVGAYQITGETMRRYAPQVFGANWQNVVFTPENQDKLGEAIYNDRVVKGGAAPSTIWESLSRADDAKLKGKPWDEVRGFITQKETGIGGGQSGSPGGRMGQLQSQAQLIASYDQAPPTGRAAYSPQGMATMQIVKSLNPTYDATQYQRKLASVRDFAVKNGNAVSSISKVVDHLDVFQAAAQALSNGNIQGFNYINNTFRKTGGSALPTNFDAIKGIVADEITKAILPGGGTGGEREKAAAILSNVQSPDQLAGAIYQIKALMVGQLAGLKRQYETNTQRTDFLNMVSPKTRAVMGFRPPAEAITYLKQNSDANTRSWFDKTYGSDSSAYYLGRR